MNVQFQGDATITTANVAELVEFHRGEAIVLEASGGELYWARLRKDAGGTYGAGDNMSSVVGHRVAEATAVVIGLTSEMAADGGIVVWSASTSTVYKVTVL